MCYEMFKKQTKDIYTKQLAKVFKSDNLTKQAEKKTNQDTS